MTPLKTLSLPQKIGVVLAAVFYVVAGTLHFVKPEPYLKIIPPYIPWHVTIVRISGAFEILGGLGLLITETRRPAAWGLMALLVAVFPANVYMATNPMEAGAVSIAPVLRWGRLPLQLLLIWWLLWSTDLLGKIKGVRKAAPQAGRVRLLRPNTDMPRKGIGLGRTGRLQGGLG